MKTTKVKISQALHDIKSKFYWSQGRNWDEFRGEPELASYGIYRIGLTTEEIKNYLRARANKMAIERIYKKFCDIAGCNTMGLSPTGEGLMYRHDVQRFADKLFLNKPTYFD